MEREKLESLLIDYIDDTLDAAGRRLVESQLANNADARRLYQELGAIVLAMKHSHAPEPTEKLASNFYKLLEKEQADVAKGETIVFRPVFFRIAAAVALMIISGFVGFWLSKNNEEQRALADVRKEMEDTRKELLETRDIMLGLLNNEQSPSQRIQGVNVAMELPLADDEIVKVLMHTMLADPNTNVRLAALDALAKFQHEPKVRAGLIIALSKQTNPMVQIRLIQLMVHMKEKDVVDDLQRLVDDAETMKAVKDEAHNGILKLS